MTGKCERTGLVRRKTAGFAVALAVLGATSSGVSARQDGSVVATPAVRADQAGNSNHYRWITLGTMGGPRLSLDRAQPANLLLNGTQAHLIDAGDGAATEAFAAGAQFQMLRSIWISHIHFDHIGGLSAVLGLRLQVRTMTPLTIFGPPGIKGIVDDLIAAMRPSAELGYGVPGEVPLDPAAGIKVVEVNDGSVVNFDGFTVKVARNCHCSFPPGSAGDLKFRSLSFRFDLPGRSIVYTGDTGPCDSVERLAQGADLLVTELIDIEDTVNKMRLWYPDIPASELDKMEEHLRTHHLTTAEIGRMAASAHVGEVVATHIAGGGNAKAIADGGYVAEIHRFYNGPVTVAKDGEAF